MKRTAALLAGVALALSLAACGSGSDASSTSSAPVENADRQTLIDEIRADGEASGATAEQIDCVINAIAELDAVELQSIKDGTPSADTQAVMTAASEACLPAAASPAAS